MFALATTAERNLTDIDAPGDRFRVGRDAYRSAAILDREKRLIIL